MAFKKYLFAFIGLTLMLSCGDPSEKEINDNFDRAAMLSSWADLIIIPAYEAYVLSLEDLKSKQVLFVSNTSQTSLDDLRISYIDAYKAWQHVSMFEIGKAEELSLRSYTNVFPTDVSLIAQNIVNTNTNLSLPSNYVAQGFPALDYLLYGIADNDPSILNAYNSVDHQNYLAALVDRLHDLGSTVSDDWSNGYRDTFIANDGSSATASVDKMVNDFLFYYEKFLRAGKVGIPAGVFSGNTISSSVEAPYSEIYSKDLFLEAFIAVKDFFKGTSFDNTVSGVSLVEYLDHIRELNISSEVSTSITDQWNNVDAKAEVLDDNFKNLIDKDNTFMLELYDELQKAVITLKVDMMQALNIQIDYVDADGD